MPKRKNSVGGITYEEWEALPTTFDAGVAARIIGKGKRFAYNHADELGGKKIGNRVFFFKAKMAEIVGLDVT